MTSLRYAADDNLAAWKALPQLEGVNLVAGAKPDATVLAVHPRLKTKTGKPMPVIVAGEYGKGRSLAITTDTLWRWGFVAAARPGDDGRQYTKFWENSIRWLIQDPDLRNLHVDSDAVEYVPGAPVRVTVRLLGRDYQPLAERRGLARASSAAPIRHAPSRSRRPKLDGRRRRHRGRTSSAACRPASTASQGHATIAGREVDASDIFLVREGGTELDRPVGDKATLEAIAAGHRRRARSAPIDELPPSLAFDPPRIVRVDRRTDVELWSRPGLLILVVGLLGLEWLLRQRSGYL